MIAEEVEVKKVRKLEEERQEIIFGQVYMMASPNIKHQILVGNLYFEIRKKEKCMPIVAPFDLKVECKGFENIVQPDVMVFCEEDFPCAIFEVISPSSAVRDKVIKKEFMNVLKLKSIF